MLKGEEGEVFAARGCFERLPVHSLSGMLRGMKTRKFPWVPLALCCFLLAAVAVIIAGIAAITAIQLP